MAKNFGYGFVFLGHGEIDDRRRIGLLFFVTKERKGPIRVRWIRDPKPAFSIPATIGPESGMRLAIIIACKSGWVKPKDLEFGNSVIGAILEGTNDLPFVIGAQSQFDMSAAEIFLETMLATIFTKPLDLAIADARNAIHSLWDETRSVQYSSLDWWIPVLYAKNWDFELAPRFDAVDNMVAQRSFVTGTTEEIDGRFRRAEAKSMLSAIGRRLIETLSGSDGKESKRLVC